MCALCEIVGIIDKGGVCKNKATYRESVQKPVTQIGFMINKLKFVEQMEIGSKTISCLAFTIRSVAPEREKAFWEAIIKSAKEGADALTRLKENGDNLPKETCCLCDNEFFSDNSNEVPVCPSCLMTAGEPKKAQKEGG